MTKEENTLKGEGMKVYEVGYLLLPGIEESKVQEESSKIRDIIEKNNGMFLSEGAAEMRTLTYPMSKAISGKKQKFNNAYFGWIKFEGNAETAVAVKNDLDKFDNILRYILIITVKENAVMPGKSGKFSFDKKKTEKEVKEEKEEKEESGIDEKKLDESIDELVIE